MKRFWINRLLTSIGPEKNASYIHNLQLFNENRHYISFFRMKLGKKIRRSYELCYWIVHVFNVHAITVLISKKLLPKLHKITRKSSFDWLGGLVWIHIFQSEFVINWRCILILIYWIEFLIMKEISRHEILVLPIVFPPRCFQLHLSHW